MLSLLFGHTTFAISTVITAFMGGLALGSYYFGRLADTNSGVMTFLKKHGVSPLFLAYGIMEAMIGVYCLFTPFLFRVTESVYLRFSEASFLALSLIRFFLCAIVLVFPTFLMGGTLPLLSKFFINHGEELGRKLGFLYFINTIGAAVGAFTAGFYLIRTFGIQTSLVCAASINILIGLAVYLFNRRLVPGSKPLPVIPEATRRVYDMGSGKHPLPMLLLFFAFAFTGFAAMAYEICWTRALTLSLGSSTYAFTTMLTTFLAGIALGSVLYGYLSDRYSFSILTFAWLEVATGVFCLLSIYLLGKMPLYFIALFPYVRSSHALIMVSDFVLSCLAMLIPTVLMGFIFPLVGKLYTEKFRELGRRLGEIYAINTVGCIFGSFVTGFVFIPLLGVQNSLKIAVSINIACGVIFLFHSRLNRFKKAVSGLLVAPILIFTGFMPSWNPSIMSSGAAVYADWYMEGTRTLPKDSEKPIFYKDGITSTVSVFKSEDNTYLKVNGKTDASTSGDMPTQLLLGYIPVLYHQASRDIFIVGLGSGITAKAVLDFPHIGSVTCAELEPSVIEASRYFAKFNGDVLKNKRFTIKTDDGRNALLASSRKYDIIISEPSNPWIAGVSNLFTKDFYETSKAKLKAGGVFCQWFQLYDIDPADVKMVLNTFYSVFPHGVIWRGCDADLILLGADRPLIMDYQAYSHHFRENQEFQKALMSINITVPDAIFAHYIADASQLATVLKTAGFNTDDLPVLEFSAPKSLYAETALANIKGLYRLKVKNIPDLTGYQQGKELPADYYLALYRDVEEVFSEHMLQEAVRNHPDDVGIRLLKVKYLLKQKSFIQAESELRSMVSKGSRDYRVHLELARIYSKEDLKETAEKMYAEAYRLNSGESEVVSEYVGILIALKRYEEALPLAQKARRDFPDDDTEWKNTTGTILVRLKRYPEALPVVQAVLNDNPDDETALKNLFQIYKESKDTERLLQTGAHFLKKRYSDSEVFVELGKAYASKGDYPKAKEAFDKGIRADPYNQVIAGELFRIGFQNRD